MRGGPTGTLCIPSIRALARSLTGKYVAMLCRILPLHAGAFGCAKLLYEDLRAVSVAKGGLSLFAACAALAIEGSRAILRIAITTEMQVEVQRTSASFAGREEN